MTYYPLNDFGPLMKGMVIGGMGIFHVFLAQFAIGGGMLMMYFQWLAMTGREPAARRFLDGYFKFLVLVSFVTGALTGVGMWFTTIQVSAPTIGRMVEEFHWIWATEYTFFALEVVAGYAFYRYGKDLPDRVRMTLLAIYTVAAWFSLFWINGILSWQLTPGQWLESGNAWDGFFNPSFWPSLFFRTVVSLTIAALVGCLVINMMTDVERALRQRLIQRTMRLLAGMVLMPVLGAWFLAVLAPDSRAWVLGGSVAMTMFFTIAVGASVLIGGYAVVSWFNRRLYLNAATASLLIMLAFGATAGGEFVREGVRKPYTIRYTLYANAIDPEHVAAMRETGSVTDDPYPLLNPEQYANDQLRLGAKVFRLQCAVCHTMDGANGVEHLAGTWTDDMKRMNFAKLHQLKTFMPPFAGTAEELEAVVQLINWQAAGRPADWLDSRTLDDYDAHLAEIEAWFDEAGVRTDRPWARSEKQVER